MSVPLIAIVVVAVVALALAASAIRIVREYERGRVSSGRAPVAGCRGPLTLRTLQTLAEVATGHNSTLVLPIPIEVLDALRDRTPTVTVDGHSS
jgi:hypothetical protein